MFGHDDVVGFVPTTARQTPPLSSRDSLRSADSVPRFLRRRVPHPCDPTHGGQAAGFRFANHHLTARWGDQLRRLATGPAGAPTVATPHLGRFVGDAVSFTGATRRTASACAPASRSSPASPPAATTLTTAGACHPPTGLSRTTPLRRVPDGTRQRVVPRRRERRPYRSRGAAGRLRVPARLRGERRPLRHLRLRTPTRNYRHFLVVSDPDSVSDGGRVIDAPRRTGDWCPPVLGLADLVLGESGGRWRRARGRARRPRRCPPQYAIDRWRSYAVDRRRNCKGRDR